MGYLDLEGRGSEIKSFWVEIAACDFPRKRDREMSFPINSAHFLFFFFLFFGGGEELQSYR